MAAPRPMTSKTLNALKGWPQLNAVDFHTEYDPSITVEVLPGSVLHLNSDGRYIRGVGNESVMPLFAFSSSIDFDVVNEAPNPATEKGNWVAINPTGQAVSLVAIGAYELVSTAFDPDETYDPNTALTSPLTTDNAGKLVPGTLYTNMIVGIVSRGVVDNGYGYDAVAFWPFPVFPNP
jgi:hypothetical protein